MSHLTPFVLSMLIFELVLSACMLITCILGLIKFTKSHGTQQPPLLFHSGLVFCVITSVFFLGLFICSLYTLARDDVEDVQLLKTAYLAFQCIVTVGYGMHCCSLWMLLFFRLHLVFKDTVYRLTTNTIRCWIVLFVFVFVVWLISDIRVIVFVIFASDGPSPYKTEGFVISALLWVSMAVVPMSLSLSFVRRLLSIFQEVSDSLNGKEDALLSPMTKSTILTLCSAPFTALLLLGFIFTDTNWKIVGPVLFTLDAYSNFICVMLSYQEFDGYYMTLCKSCDAKCKLWCHAIARGTNGKRTVVDDSYQPLTDL